MLQVLREKTMNDSDWDKLLKIRTTGRDDSRADQHCYPYEPTPYSVLERLAGSGLITKKNVLVDFGCGKGRVDFYLAWQAGCRCIGVEYDKRIWQAALDNRNLAVSGSKTTFMNLRAEVCPVPDEVDRFYFFNPFSAEILQRVLGRITDSWYEHPRRILLFFYYPSDEYISYLMSADQVLFVDEIDCRDLYAEKDSRERILIFALVPVWLEEEEQGWPE